MIFSRPLSSFHRSDLLTLSTMTYTSMQGLGYILRSLLLSMLGRDKE